MGWRYCPRHWGYWWKPLKNESFLFSFSAASPCFRLDPVNSQLYHCHVLSTDSWLQALPVPPSPVLSTTSTQHAMRVCGYSPEPVTSLLQNILYNLSSQFPAESFQKHSLSIPFPSLSHTHTHTHTHPISCVLLRQDHSMYILLCIYFLVVFQFNTL